MIKPYLSVVIPAYNEETNIRLGALDTVSRYLDGQKYEREVILVNDGSTDRTGELLRAYTAGHHNFRFIDNHHMGKAGSVITGMRDAKGEIVLFCDLDQATPIPEVKKLLPWFGKGYDIVIGSRNSKREGAPMLRRIMAKGFMILRSMVLGIHGISDTQCGFKAFRRQTIGRIFSRLKRYGKVEPVSGSMVTAGFDIEVLYLAKKMGFSIKEVAVEWHYVETRRVNPMKDSWQGLIDIFAIRLNAWRGRYQ
ncbi:MAG: Glycosyl transferase family 2 [Microgenomates group bacterium GW2011_GWA2_47_8]|nr:MAG: Glycosyl transferase family 2 [Microgenomates group bacterium GW2011_GWA2_47_8]